MELPEIVVNAHEWHKTALVRVLLVLASLLTLVMASGAGCGWW
jgi:hypothetical protein